MKKVFILQALILVVYSSSGQILKNKTIQDSLIDTKYLVGIWQADTSLDGAAWLDNYQFYSDNNFTFNFNEYNANKRILRFSGSFGITKDTIFFVIKKIFVLEGGVLKRGASAWGNEWFYKNPQIRQIDVKESCKFFALLENTKYKNANPCLLIDNRKYFKLRNDPTDY